MFSTATQQQICSNFEVSWNSDADSVIHFCSASSCPLLDITLSWEFLSRQQTSSVLGHSREKQDSFPWELAVPTRPPIPLAIKDTFDVKAGVVLPVPVSRPASSPTLDSLLALYHRLPLFGFVHSLDCPKVWILGGECGKAYAPGRNLNLASGAKPGWSAQILFLQWCDGRTHMSPPSLPEESASGGSQPL